MTNSTIDANGNHHAPEGTTDGGKFQDQLLNEPATDSLQRPSSAQPVTIRIKLEYADDRDNIMELETVEFDGRAILDARGTDEIDPDAVDDDDIMFAAQRLGLVGDHGGPFSVYLDDDSVREYIEERDRTGLAEAVSGEPRRSSEQIAEQRTEVEKQIEALHRKQFDIAKDEIQNEILATYPTATEIHLVNVNDDPFDTENAAYHVWMVRTDQDEPEQIESYESSNFAIDSAALNRFGSNLKQVSERGGTWFGIKVGT